MEEYRRTQRRRMYIMMEGWEAAHKIVPYASVYDGTSSNDGPGIRRF
jgi:hypothetical protein